MIIVLFIGTVLTFIIYNVNDWIVYEILKRRFYKYRDETFTADSSKALAISQIGVKAVLRIKRSIFFRSKYHVLVREIETMMDRYHEILDDIV